MKQDYYLYKSNKIKQNTLYLHYIEYKFINFYLN